MRKKSFRILSFVLSLILFFVSINIGFTVKADEPESSVYINSEETQAIYTYEGYTVTFTLNGSWEGGHNVGIKIDNTGTENIEDWTLESDYSYVISDIWNASVIENSEGICKIYHNEWNSVIYPGACVEFGFASQEDFVSFPSYYTILGRDIKETDAEQYSIDYAVTDDWGEGYSGTVTITNNSEEPINNWVLDFSCNNENISVWNAYIISHEGTRISVKNGGFNSIINPGESVSFGFEIYNLTNRDEFYDYSLNESVETSNSIPQDDIEPLGDIGQAYVKELHDEDVVFDETTGIRYVKNQLLISAYMGTPREAIEEIVDEVGASIVGYIEATCDYQIEFNNQMSFEDLHFYVSYIKNYSYISNVSLNYAAEMSVSSMNTNDTLYNDGKVCDLGQKNGLVITQKEEGYDDWDEDFPEGDNWNLEALHIPSAWDCVDSNYEVKIGIYDSYFEVNRDDGELVFSSVENNPQWDSSRYSLAHGSHVAGIIGAERNNNTGVAGVANNVSLNGYSIYNTSKYTSLMFDKIVFSKFIVNNVRIINCSIEYSDTGMVYAASNNNGKARDFITQEAEAYEEFLLKLDNAGYDYLIVVAAGNNNYEYYKSSDDSNSYGYIKSVLGDGFYVKNLKAKYSNPFAAITNTRLKNRIIVVGSIDRSLGYHSTSCVGDRVDVCAPGKTVLSTVPFGMNYPEGSTEKRGYGLMSGTSMAAPHITGLAALVLQANPDLNCYQVKRIICSSENSTKVVVDSLNSYHSVPNAQKCVLKAQNTAGESVEKIDYPKGIISGNVEPAIKSDICAIRKDTGDYNLDYYSFSFSSNEEGVFYDALPQGKYDIIVSANGYYPLIYKDYEIKPDIVNSIKFKLVKYKGKVNPSIDGRIIDAISGNPISNAKIKLRTGWGAESGDHIVDLRGEDIAIYTDSTGSFSLKMFQGNYTLEIEKEGYITAFYNAVAIPENNKDIVYAISPVLPENEYRIIVTWGQTPRDIDSHLTYFNYGGQAFHVYYSNPTAIINGRKIAKLDVDDVNGYGPETITIDVDDEIINNGEFRYSLYNFSNEELLSKSDACIKIYKGNTLECEVIYVPREATCRVWHVFDITSKGVIIKNDYYDVNSSLEVR